MVDDSDELAGLDSALDDVPESNLSEYVLKKLNPYKRVIWEEPDTCAAPEPRRAQVINAISALPSLNACTRRYRHAGQSVV